MECFSCKTQFYLRVLLGVLMFLAAVGAMLLFSPHAGAAALFQVDQPVVQPDNAPLQNWQMILAFLLPLIIQVLTSRNWSGSVKALAAFAISTVCTVGTMALTNQFTGDFDVITKALQVFALTIPFYYGFWKPMGTTDAIAERKGQ